METFETSNKNDAVISVRNYEAAGKSFRLFISPISQNEHDRFISELDTEVWEYQPINNQYEFIDGTTEPRDINATLIFSKPPKKSTEMLAYLADKLDNSIINLRDVKW